jgi:Ca2+-binding EF-hand superfamily protein
LWCHSTLKLRRAFIAADADRSGYLSEREVVRVARELDLVPRPFSADDIEDALRRCPSFNDGRASYHEVMDLLPWVD